MHRYSRSVLIPVSALMVVTSLGASGQDKKKNADNQELPAALEGTWTGPCEKSENDLNDEWDLSEVTYTATDGKASIKKYSKAGCADADLVSAFHLESTYTTSGNKMNLNVTKIALTPFTDEFINGIKAICPTLTITRGTETDVSKCEFYKEVLGKSYSIFKIEGSKLFTGKNTDTLDGSSEAKRPTEFDTENPLTRK